MTHAIVLINAERDYLGRLGGHLAEVEHGLQIVLRVGLEGDHRQRLGDARQLGQPLGHDPGQRVALGHAQDRDEVPLAGD